MDSLGSILPKVLHRRGLHAQASASLVTFKATEWLTLALPGLVHELTVEHLRDGTLTIACGHPIAAQECQALVPGLLEYLQRECPSISIREIRLTRSSRRITKDE